MSGALVVGNTQLFQANKVTLAGPVQGSGTLVKTGAGIVLLGASPSNGGANTYAGGTALLTGSLGFLDRGAEFPRAGPGPVLVNPGTLPRIRIEKNLEGIGGLSVQSTGVFLGALGLDTATGSNSLSFEDGAALNPLKRQQISPFGVSLHRISSYDPTAANFTTRYYTGALDLSSLGSGGAGPRGRRESVSRHHRDRHGDTDRVDGEFDSAGLGVSAGRKL
jgi:hypothetical protein